MFGNRRKSSSTTVPLTTLIAEGVEITGDLAFNGGVRIDGRIKGDLLGRTAEGQGPSLLVLSDKGRIDGSVRCGDAVINGTITGDLDVVHRLQLQSDARVSGTSYNRLVLITGDPGYRPLKRVRRKIDRCNVDGVQRAIRARRDELRTRCGRDLRSRK